MLNRFFPTTCESGLEPTVAVRGLMYGLSASTVLPSFSGYCAVTKTGIPSFLSPRAGAARIITDAQCTMLSNPAMAGAKRILHVAHEEHRAVRGEAGGRGGGGRHRGEAAGGDGARTLRNREESTPRRSEGGGAKGVRHRLGDARAGRLGKKRASESSLGRRGRDVPAGPGLR
jgi:hypothetical protein